MEHDIMKAYRTVESLFSEETIRTLLTEIANTAGPSQTIRFTRGPVIERLLAMYQAEDMRLDLNYLQTGNTMLSFKAVEPTILFIAHLDQISYLLDRKVSDTDWHVFPFCKHLSKIEVPAVAVRFNPDLSQYEQVAAGTLYSQESSSGLQPFFQSSNDLMTGDRIVYDHPLTVENGMAKGNIDNAAGVSACLLAALTLFQVNPDLPIGFVFTDEEEGPASDPAYFARGARRLMRRIQAPRLCIVVDGHGGQGSKDMGKGAFFTEKTSEGIATVTPPDLYVRFKAKTESMRKVGINFFEDEGRVSRGDDVACLEVTSQVLSVGYPSVNRHYDQDSPAVMLSDLLHLSKALFFLGMSYGLENSR